MRAYQLPKSGGIEALAMTELPRPQPDRRQVLVRVAACSLNYRDLAIVLGQYNAPMKPNVILLSDGAGEVVAVGADVTRAKVGDRVAGCFYQSWMGGPIRGERLAQALGGSYDGMLTECAVLEEEGVVQLPDHLSYEEGATLACAGVTAWQAVVDHGQVKPGDTVLVQGTGGVSMFALQFAKLAGARVIATSSSDDKLKRVRELGAAHTINYKTTPEWDKAAVAYAGGGIDQVVEVGGADTFARSLGAIRTGGKISMIGVLTREGQVNPLMILGKRADIRGISVGSTEMFEAMNRAIAANKLKPVIDKTFPFDQAADAVRYLQSAKHFGKIVIKVS